MRRTTWLVALGFACLVAVAVAGRTSSPQRGDPPQVVTPVKKVAVGRNVSVEIQGRKVVRVVVQAHVCLRQGSLEHLLCRRRTKEHEAILAADIDAAHLHTALLLAGAEAGRPVTFEPKEIPPSGTTVKITLVYNDKDGKEVKVPAQQWVRHATTKKNLGTDWVFVGSGFIQNPSDPARPYYLANDGDVICVANFEAAVLDLPIWSPASGENDYEAHTERIPPEGTPVQVILEVVPPKKK
jgi:hypothetical protein